MIAMACARPNRSLLVFAAASTSDAMTEVSRLFGKPVRFSFGSSGDLARQIEAGAPADVFLSADVARMDRLEKGGHVRSRRDLLKNKLVVITAPGSTLGDLTQVNRLAIGDPSNVPAGAYAKEYLERVGLWASVSSRVVPTLDVRAALAAVETGAADAAIVYRTDVSKNVRVAFEPAEQPKIVYPLGVLTRASEHADAFAAFCAGEGRAVFDRHGFT
jgi:molybdate transport system substrate-binding protein